MLAKGVPSRRSERVNVVEGGGVLSHECPGLNGAGLSLKGHLRLLGLLALILKLGKILSRQQPLGSQESAAQECSATYCGLVISEFHLYFHLFIFY